MAESKRQFSAVPPQCDFVQLEKDTAEWWRDNDILKKYLGRNRGSEKRYSFFDGPITANNAMGVHHAWGRTYKDLYHRFRNMQGYAQRFQNGFDGQGLWVEVEVEKEKNFKSKQDIEKYGVGKFVEECKARVRHYADIITEQSMRLAYFMDWDNSYHTMSETNNYAIWNFLKHCHSKGWLYEGRDVMPWCTRCGTGLSQHEIVTDGYREVTHKSIFVKFPLIDDPDGGSSFLVWTTTPWTMPANVMAAVNPELTYVRVRNYLSGEGGTREEYLWLAKGCLGVLKGKYEIVKEARGAELVDRRYKGPYDELDAQSEARSEHRVIGWKGVSEAEGTGIVHMAPGAGADDYKLGREFGLPILAPLDDSGYYQDGYGWLSGRQVATVRDDIFEDLLAKGLLYRQLNYTHRYPFCWRCGTELVFRLVGEWFISMDELRQQMMDATNAMEWVPGFGKDRELDWLRNMDDWMISKKRYWGLALPIFKCGGCDKVEVIGSREELRQRAVEGWEQLEGHSPHRPWMDSIRIACGKCGGLVERIKDVGNPWLDAGIVPFSTLSRDKDSPDFIDHWYPGNWFSESFPGQFRNWFYSLIAMSVALEGKAPAQSVFSYALMRNQDGEEMHKSRGTSILFEKAADEFGVDVMRWLFCRQDPAVNLNFGERPCSETRRQFFIPLWNIYSFFVTYANIDGWNPEAFDLESGDITLSELDRWILAELNGLITEVSEHLERWAAERATRAIEGFVDRLSNWYVRRSRRRFWKSGESGDKFAAYSTLYECLTVLAKLLAPFAPHIAEALYRNLVAQGREETVCESVHLADWPLPRKEFLNKALTEVMRTVVTVTELGRRARTQAMIKVRQPLSEMLVELPPGEAGNLPSGADDGLREIILDELNIKDIKLTNNDSSVALSEAILKPNFALLGPRLGRRAKEVQVAFNSGSTEQHQEWEQELNQAGSIAIGDDLRVNRDEVLIERRELDGYSVINENGRTVAINTEISDELRIEGWAREVVHSIQNLRKERGLDIPDRIKLYWEIADPQIKEALESYRDYIAQETLALEIVEQAGVMELAGAIGCDLGAGTVNLALEKVQYG